MKACCGFKFPKMHISAKNQLPVDIITSGFYISLKATMS